MKAWRLANPRCVLTVTHCALLSLTRVLASAVYPIRTIVHATQPDGTPSKDSKQIVLIGKCALRLRVAIQALSFRFRASAAESMLVFKKRIMAEFKLSEQDPERVRVWRKIFKKGEASPLRLYREQLSARSQLNSSS